MVDYKKKNTPNRISQGEIETFNTNWNNLPPDNRYYFKKGQAENQIQFAFQNHWSVFQRILSQLNSGRVLEVGCGRGSMAAFFAHNGFETYLLDTSFYALGLARSNFRLDGLIGYSIQGNALHLPYPDASFDVIVSIGLLEHFTEIGTPLSEQLRVVKPGGYFLGYVVPHRAFSVQTLAKPVNTLLKIEHFLGFNKSKPIADNKEMLFRNSCSAVDYLGILESLNVQESGSMGMFPVPLISHSLSFPFSTMSLTREQKLIKLWQVFLKVRAKYQKDPWTCAEGWGLAFLVWARK